MLRDYLFDLYIPAAELHARRTAAGGRAGTQLRRWARMLRKHWAQLHLGSVSVTQAKAMYRFRLAVYLGENLPDTVDVQLYADAVPPRNAAFCESMHRGEPIPGSANGYTYTLDVPAPCVAEQFTPRIVPRHDLARVPIELGLIAWGTRCARSERDRGKGALTGPA
jgi:starch phosphorylase